MTCAVHTLETNVCIAEKFTLRRPNLSKCCNIICISGNTEHFRETLRIILYICNFKIQFACPLHRGRVGDFLIYIREIPSSIPSPRTICPDSFSYFFSLLRQENYGIIGQSREDLFLPHLSDPLFKNHYVIWR